MDRRGLMRHGAGALMAGMALGPGLAARALAAPGGDLTEAGLDAIVAPFLEKFEVPGLAVAVVRPGMAPLARGYGLRVLGRPDRVDAHTRFAIASNSKAFTTALLAQLVDAGKLAWDDPVTRHLPEFRLYDPVVTQMMTVRDLLIHNSGLPLGAGDLMTFPATTHTLADILHGLRWLKPETGFRTSYAYDNMLYLVAGMVISRLTGQSWEDAVTTRILKPLGMNETVPGFSHLGEDNVAGRHARLGPPVRGIGPLQVLPPHNQDKIDAAGGLNASAHDAAAWLGVQLARGRMPDGHRLWSEAQSDEMWRPRTVMGSGPGPDASAPQRSVIYAYALGWIVSQYRGQRLCAHSGGLDGQITQHALLPELGCAVSVYSNTEDGMASVVLRNALLDRLIGAGEADWVALGLAAQEKSRAAVLDSKAGNALARPAGGPSLPLAAYAGRYRDPWYGDVVVSRQGDALAISFARTPAFAGPLEPWGADAFRTRFPAEAGEDAVVHFAVAKGKVTRVTMKALSPLADFSYDFQHLDFTPVPVARKKS